MPVRARWTAYAGFSTALAGGVVLKALAQRPNFYSAAVYLSQSSANLMILTNFLFVIACSILVGLQKLLYGPLRPIETEQLYEKAWFAITETCLAMTIFRGEIGASFLVMFFALLAGKVWGWIGEGRVEILEQQPPRNPRLFHTRLALSLGLSVIFDLSLLEYVIKQVMRMARPDMMVMFGFEFAVLSIASLSTAARYAINLVEIGVVRDQKRKRAGEVLKERVEAAKAALERAQQADRSSAPLTGPNEGPNELSQTSTLMPATSPTVETAQRALREAQLPVEEHDIEVEGWEGKGRWIFYLDLATDFFKLIIYVSFFFILLIFYGLPIHIMRDVFLTFRSFFKRISDFLNYRTATRDMNARYPDATAGEIAREDVCIICREEMRPYEPPGVQQSGQRAPNPVAERMRPKKLPCGHILHFSCLRSWLERQQICPTCRTSVVPRPTISVPGQTGQGGQQAGQAGQIGQVGAAQGAHPPGQRQGPRIFQWGPLRIGVGAARGNMLDELQRGLAEGRAAALRPPNANPNGPREYGFGIRWDMMRRRTPERNQQASVQEQIDALGHRIQQEVRSLNGSAQELQVLRVMDIELQRLRSRRQGETVSAVHTSIIPQAVPAGVRNVSADALLSQGMTQTVTRTLAMDTQGNANVLRAGDPNLPAGLTLPEGWTMLPLHPSGNSASEVRGLPFAGQATGGIGQHFSHPFQVPGSSPQTNLQAPQPQTNVANATLANHFGGHSTVAHNTGQSVTNTTHSDSSPTQSARSRSGSIDAGEQLFTFPTVASTYNQRGGSVQSPLRQAQSNIQQGESSIPRSQPPPAETTSNGERTDRAIANGDQDSSAASLPLWGSPNIAAAKPRRSPDDSVNHSSTAEPQSATISDHGNTETKSRAATVEDFIEGPD